MAVRRQWGAVCLAVFILVVVATGASPVQAQNDAVLDQEAENVEQRRIIALLQQQRDVLSKREAQLDEREKELKILQGEVEKKLARLEKARTVLEDLLNQKERIEGQRLADLSGIYQRMDPARAAAALDTMEQDLAIGILSQMRSKGAGEILNEMSKEKAAELSRAFTQLDRTSSPP